MSGLGMGLEAILHSDDSWYGSNAFEDLLELRFEDQTAQRNGAVGGGHTNGARMRDQPSQTSTHPLDEHVVDRLGLLNELRKQARRDTAQPMLHIARRHFPNFLRNAIGMCGHRSQPGPSSRTFVRIRHVHERGASAGAGQTDKQLVHSQTPRSPITPASFAALCVNRW
jgi:hypothetical protein